MKLKALLLVVFAAGLGASLALADSGKPHDKGAGCRPVRLEGTVAPQSLTLTVAHSGPEGLVAAGSQVTLTLGSAGQTVRANVEACSTGTGSALQFTVRQVELHAVKPENSESTGAGSTTTGKGHGDDDQGEHHKGTTTTTTTPTTTSTGTTTTGGTTTTTTP
jgi:hypothetical protein